MAYFSEGAFTFSEVYDMPLPLRRFYMDQLVAQKKLEGNRAKRSTRRPSAKK